MCAGQLSCSPVRLLHRAESRYPPNPAVSSATGLKAWPSSRKGSRLRCSLDSARNDGYEIWFNIHLNMRLVVQKYGGTSVGTPERICHVAQRILETQRQGCGVVAVVSAMAGVTDELVRLGHAVATQPTKRELDIVLSTGEQAAAALTAMAVTGLGGTT